jgi:rubrerythrin
MPITDRELRLAFPVRDRASSTTPLRPLCNHLEENKTGDAYRECHRPEGHPGGHDYGLWTYEPERKWTCVQCGQPIPLPTSNPFRCPECR